MTSTSLYWLSTSLSRPSALYSLADRDPTTLPEHFHDLQLKLGKTRHSHTLLQFYYYNLYVSRGNSEILENARQYDGRPRGLRNRSRSDYDGSLPIDVSAFTGAGKLVQKAVGYEQRGPLSLTPLANCSSATARRTTRTCCRPPLSSLVSSSGPSA